MFSNCISKCNTCYTHFVGGCLAGHGDDDYFRMTKKLAKEALKKGWVREKCKEELYKLFPTLKELI